MKLIAFKPFIGLGAAFILCAAFAFQYPFHSTMPMGGDAASFLTNVQGITSHILQGPFAVWPYISGSNYPLTHLAFALFAWLPLSWPSLYIWAMVAAQIAVGAMIAIFLHKIAGWSAAAWGVAIWALTPIEVNNHFEDGTLAQLISLVPLLGFFISIWVRKSSLALLLFFSMFFFHPVTGLVLLLSCLVALPTLYSIRTDNSSNIRSQRFFLHTLTATTAMAVYAIVFLGRGAQIPLDGRHINLIGTIHSHIGAFILLTIPGIFLLARQWRRQPHAVTLLLSFIGLVMLAGFNNLLDVSLWTFRFQTYLVVVMCLTAPLAADKLVRNIFPSTWIRILFITLLFFSLGLAAWQQNNHIYEAYESPSKYLRISRDELEAMEWLKNTTPKDSKIVTYSAFRNVEWTPVLTERQWRPVDVINFFDTTVQKFINNETNSNNGKSVPESYYLAFLKTEEAPAALEAHPNLFPVVYSNKGTVIFRMPSTWNLYYEP